MKVTDEAGQLALSGSEVIDETVDELLSGEVEISAERDAGVLCL